MAQEKFVLPDRWEDDPVLGSEGYPHEMELQRIQDWPYEKPSDLLDLMAYVKVRWLYPDYWTEEDATEYGQSYREYTISTGGWSGNESLIHALESNSVFSILAPWSWRRGGHFVYRLPNG